MYCSKCGKEITKNDKFCSSCGNPIGTAQSGSEKPDKDINEKIQNIANFAGKSYRKVKKETQNFLNEVVTTAEQSRNNSGNHSENEMNISDEKSNQGTGDLSESDNAVTGNVTPSITQSLTKGAVLLTDAGKEYKQKLSEKKETVKEERSKKASERTARKAEFDEKTADSKTDGFVIAGIVLLFIPILSSVCPIIFLYARWHAKKYYKKGKELALAGFFISIIVIVLTIIAMIYLLPLISNASIFLGSATQVADEAANLIGGVNNIAGEVNGAY